MPPEPGGPRAGPGSERPPMQQWGPPPGYWQPQPSVPDNGPAVAGFVLSLVSMGLLLLSFGLSSVVSLGCAVAGTWLSRAGKAKVRRAETPKHGGLAQAGFVCGIVGLVLAATLFWVLVIVLSATGDLEG